MRRFHWIALLLLAAVTAAAFSGVRHNELVDWDDLHLLVANDRYRGLSVDHLRWMFTTTLGGHYQPLTWLSYAVDHAVWGGVSAAGMHLTNLALHILTAGLLFAAARLLLEYALQQERSSIAVICGAFAAALFFAVHPLRVESVAWATERRDVLSGALLLAGVLLYLRSVQKGGDKLLLAASAGLYGLSLLSKAAGITLPLVLLAIDWYPLRRTSAPNGSAAVGLSRRLSWFHAIKEKAALLFISGGVACIALFAQWQAGALRSPDEHPLGLRVSQAAYGVVFYMGKMLWPANLIPLYEQDPQATALDWPFLLCGAVVVAISVTAWMLRRRVPALSATWVCYLLLLAPVLGLAQSGPQVAADRYTYLASMPWAVLAGGIVAKFWAGVPMHRSPAALRRAAIVVTIMALGFTCVLLTRAQVRVWKDSYTLWTTTVERAPQTGLAHANLSSLLLSRGEVERARAHAGAAIDRLPGNRLAHRVLGMASLALGDYVAAERHLTFALQIAANLGHEESGTMIALAGALTGQGKPREAEALYRDVIAAEPHEPEWQIAYAGFLAGQERWSDAEDRLRAVVQLAPARAEGWARLGILQRQQGMWAKARETFESGLIHAPGDLRLLVELAWALSVSSDGAIRDGRRALELAREAMAQAGPDWPRAQEVLAAAMAETGDFAAAVEALSRALPQAATEAQRERMERQLAAYREGRPFREP